MKIPLLQILEICRSIDSKMGFISDFSGFEKRPHKGLPMAGNNMKVGAIVTLFFLSPAFSQPDSTLSKQPQLNLLQDASKPSRAQGQEDGKLLAESIGTSRDFFAAFLSFSIGGGPIGAGIHYVLIGPDPVPEKLVAEAEKKGIEYRQGFVTGYEERTKALRRRSVRNGSLAGMGVMTLLMVYALSIPAH